MLFFWESELKQSLREGENLIRSPLREDENPSFSLNTRNGLWNDFATNQKGNIFTFIMLKYNLTFPESIKYLKNKYPNTTSSSGNSSIKKSFVKPERQGAKVDYCFLEVVKKRIYNRGHFEQRRITPNYHNVKNPGNCFHSLYWYSQEVLEYVNKNGGKIKGFKGAVWCKELTLDIDFKDSEREINIAKAQAQAKKLIQMLTESGIEPNVKFSGNKGFHITFPLCELDSLSGYILISA